MKSVSLIVLGLMVGGATIAEAQTAYPPYANYYGQPAYPTQPGYPPVQQQARMPQGARSGQAYNNAYAPSARSSYSFTATPYISAKYLHSKMSATLKNTSAELYWDPALTDYVAGNTGAPTKASISDTTDGYAVALGLTLARSPTFTFRTELEYTQRNAIDFTLSPTYSDYLTVSPRSTDQSKASLENTTTLLNFYYDFRGLNLAQGALVPYIGVGGGYSTNKATMTFNDDEVNYNVMQICNGACKVFETERTSLVAAWTVGASYAFNPNWAVDVSYRKMKLGKADWKAGASSPVFGSKDVETEEWLGGLRYSF